MNGSVFYLLAWKDSVSIRSTTAVQYLHRSTVLYTVQVNPGLLNVYFRPNFTAMIKRKRFYVSFFICVDLFTWLIQTVHYNLMALLWQLI